MELRRGLLQFPADPPCIASVVHYTAVLEPSIRSGHTQNTPSTPDHSGLAPPVAMLAVVPSSCLMLAPHLAQSRPSLPVTSDQLILLLQWLVAGGATMQHPELQTLLRSTQTSLFVLPTNTVFGLMSCLVCLVPVLTVFGPRLNCVFGESCHVCVMCNPCEMSCFVPRTLSRHN